MKIDIVQILDRGIVNQERLWLKILSNTNLQFFIVFDTSYISEKAIYTVPKHTYWFKPMDVKSGDSVVLYTRQGTQSDTLNADGSTSHFFYWGLDKTIWNTTADCAVVIEVASWKTSKYGN